MSIAIRIDDRDSSITYSSYGPTLDWEPHRGTGREFMNTTSLAQKRGVNATITFFGTSIGVYGITSEASRGIASSPTSFYILDGNAPNDFTATARWDTQYNVLFYQSPDLEDREHVLQIINQCEDSFFWLDYPIVRITVPSPSLNPPRILPSTRISTRRGTTTTSLSFSTPATSSRSGELTFSRSSTKGLSRTTPITSLCQLPTRTSLSSDAAPNNHSPTSVIVCGVLGSILGILILLILLRWIRKRNADLSGCAIDGIPLNTAPMPSSSRHFGYLLSDRARGLRTITPFLSFPRHPSQDTSQVRGPWRPNIDTVVDGMAVQQPIRRKGQTVEQPRELSAGLVPKAQRAGMSPSDSQARHTFLAGRHRNSTYDNMSLPPPYPGSSV